MLEKVMMYRMRVFVVFLLLTVLTGTQADDSIGVKPGQTAPEFELRDLRGKNRTLTQLRKSGQVLLLFWSAHCHYCYAMIPQFKDIHETYAKNGLKLVAINVGYENRGEVKDFASDNDLPYLILNDDDKKEDIIEKYQVQGTPTLVLIAQDGRVRYNGHRVPDLTKYLAAAQ